MKKLLQAHCEKTGKGYLWDALSEFIEVELQQYCDDNDIEFGWLSALENSGCILNATEKFFENNNINFGCD